MLHFCLFKGVLEKLVNSGRLNGDIIGGRQDKASYVPEIFSKTQNNWVDSFYKQNGYLGKSIIKVQTADTQLLVDNNNFNLVFDM